MAASLIVSNREVKLGTFGLKKKPEIAAAIVKLESHAPTLIKLSVASQGCILAKKRNELSRRQVIQKIIQRYPSKSI